MKPAGRDALAAFVDEVGRFYIRDRKLRSVHDAMVAALALEGPLDAEAVAAYLEAVRRYFSGFEREARRHLAHLERRLAHVSQLQFNLTAERAVAERRVEVTQGVLTRLAEVGGQ